MTNKYCRNRKDCFKRNIKKHKVQNNCYGMAKKKKKNNYIYTIQIMNPSFKMNSDYKKLSISFKTKCA